MALKVAVLCACAAIVASAIRVTRPEIALACAIAAGAAACLLSVSELEEIVSLVRAVFGDSSGERASLTTLLKASGIAIAGEYASQICRDAGEGALAQRVDFAVRISLFALAAPMVYETMKLVMELQG